MDQGAIIRQNYGRSRVHGLTRTQCKRCGGYFTEDERDSHQTCPIKKWNVAPPGYAKGSVTPTSAERKQHVAKHHLHEKQNYQTAKGSSLISKEEKQKMILFRRLRHRFPIRDITVEKGRGFYFRLHAFLNSDNSSMQSVATQIAGQSMSVLSISKISCTIEFFSGFKITKALENTNTMLRRKRLKK
jgi:hypothetical protein